ncbi:ABC transporter transmembrane region 2 superfamily domain protein [Enterobacter roggenkampii]|nr:ABC transporter [Klebsiella oxytoca]AKL38871.1 ABC transporter [Klebsiella oxytoca]PRW41958.1 ABC transporter transmembrane region 2 superfamily domain protein [Enterobacter roggenkampii]
MNMMISYQELVRTFLREGANKQVISSQADSLIKISRIWADFFPANTSNQPI